MWVAGSARTCGFTLLEMLVIVAILALASGILFPAVEKLDRAQAFAASATRVESLLHAARADAIRDGMSVRVAIAPGGHAIGTVRQIERLADTSTLTGAARGMTFFADGSASGGWIVLADRGRSRRWTVAAATGTIGTAW